MAQSGETPKDSGDRTVGQHSGMVTAGSALHKVTVTAMALYNQGEDNHAEALAAIDTALAAIDNGDPSLSTASKRELWTLFEALIEHVGDQFDATFDLDTLRLTAENTLYPTFRTVLAQSFNDRGGAQPEFAAALDQLLRGAAVELTSIDHTVLRHAVLQPLVRRTAALMDALPDAIGAEIHVRGPGEASADPDGDTRFVLRTIQGGATAGSVVGTRALKPLPAHEGAANPQLTVGSLTELARNSPNQVRGPASLNIADLRVFIRENVNEIDPNLWERRPKGEGYALGYAKGWKGAIAEVRRAGNPALDDDSPAMRDPTRDQHGLTRATFGCPASKEILGKEMLDGRLRQIPSRLLRFHEQVVIAAMQRHWELMLPASPPLDLAELGIDDRGRYRRLRLDDLPGVTVRTLPSGTGRLHVVPSDLHLARDLAIRTDGNDLSISAPNRKTAEPLTITIHTPTRLDLVARNVPHLDLEYSGLMNVAVPAGGRLRARLSTPPGISSFVPYSPPAPVPVPGFPYEPPAPPERHRIDSAIGAEIVLYGDQPGVVDLRAAGGDSALLINEHEHHSYYGNAQPGVTYVSLWEIGEEYLAGLTEATRASLQDNEPWLARHVPMRAYDDKEITRLINDSRPAPRAREGRAPGTRPRQAPRQALASPRPSRNVSL